MNEITMNDSTLRLMKSFPGSFINHNGEFIAHKKANIYFRLITTDEYGCSEVSPLEIKCKVLEWLSRSAYKGVLYKSKKKNKEFNNFMLKGINEFLNTGFGETEIQTIYRELGNKVDRPLTIKFINSNYDMDILKTRNNITI